MNVCTCARPQTAYAKDNGAPYCLRCGCWRSSVEARPEAARPTREHVGVVMAALKRLNAAEGRAS